MRYVLQIWRHELQMRQGSEIVVFVDVSRSFHASAEEAIAVAGVTGPWSKSMWEHAGTEFPCYDFDYTTPESLRAGYMVDPVEFIYSDEMKWIRRVLKQQRDWDKSQGMWPHSNPADIRDELGRTMACFVGVSRDSESLARSNWEVITDDMCGRFPDHANIYRWSSSFVGWIEELVITLLDENGDPTDAALAAYKWSQKLENYPVADEEHWSNMEWEETHSWVSDELRRCWLKPDLIADELANQLMREARELAELSGRNIEELAREHGWIEEDDDEA